MQRRNGKGHSVSPEKEGRVYCGGGFVEQTCFEPEVKDRDLWMMTEDFISICFTLSLLSASLRQPHPVFPVFTLLFLSLLHHFPPAIPSS